MCITKVEFVLGLDFPELSLLPQRPSVWNGHLVDGFVTLAYPNAPILALRDQGDHAIRHILCPRKTSNFLLVIDTHNRECKWQCTKLLRGCVLCFGPNESYSWCI